MIIIYLKVTAVHISESFLFSHVDKLIFDSAKSFLCLSITCNYEITGHY